MSNASSSPAIASSPSLAGVPWRPVAAFLIVVGGYIAQFVAQFAVVFAAMPFVGTHNIDSWLETPGAQFAGILASELLAILVIAYFLHRRHIPFLKGVGLQRTKPAKVIFALLIGFAIYLGLMVISEALLRYVPFIKLDQAQAIGFGKNVSGTGLGFAFVSLIILPPIAEEMIFRGFFYGSLRHYLRFGWSLAITSLFFGFLHVFTGESTLLWSAAIDTFLLSAVLCTVREKTGSIWATIGIHALKNGVAFLYLFILHQ